jgi:hypothetical protein
MEKKDILNVLNKYKQVAANKYGITSLGVFGSVARNEAEPLSDLDICVQMDKPDPFYLVHIKSDLENLLNIQVDVVRVREKMNPHLKKRIEQEVVYV